jgi:hypothetical protein
MLEGVMRCTEVKRMKHLSGGLLSLIGTVLLTGVLAACAGMQRTPGPSLDPQQLDNRGYRLGEEVRRVPAFEISGWNYIDERHMQIEGGPGRVYLVTFRYPCHELAGADRIGYTDSVGTFGRNDRIVVFEAGRRVDCPVGKLHKLERIDRDPAALRMR